MRHVARWSLAASVELGKLADIDGARPPIAVTNRDSRNLGRGHPGSTMRLADVHGDGKNLDVADLPSQLAFDDGRREVRLDRLRLRVDFTCLHGNFRALGFCGSPRAVTLDPGWRDFPPGAQDGCLGFLSGTECIGTGSHQVNSSQALGSQCSKLDISGTTGELLPAEVGAAHTTFPTAAKSGCLTTAPMFPASTKTCTMLPPRRAASSVCVRHGHMGLVGRSCNRSPRVRPVPRKVRRCGRTPCWRSTIRRVQP